MGGIELDITEAEMKIMNESYITYTEQSIQSSFKEHYLVPEYQREYVWEHNQVEQLLSDLLEAYGYNPEVSE